MKKLRFILVTISTLLMVSYYLQIVVNQYEEQNIVIVVKDNKEDKKNSVISPVIRNKRTSGSLFYIVEDVAVKQSPNDYSVNREELASGESHYGEKRGDWVYLYGYKGYVKSEYCSLSPIEKTYQINSRGFKSYMDYTKLSSRSKQGELQTLAYSESGLRKVNGRYCVAIGSAVKPKIGQYFDLILENGMVIKAIVSDVKAPADTFEDNMTTKNGCVSEFVVDTKSLSTEVRRSGDVSNYTEEWKSPVKNIILYDENVFE